MPMRRVEIFFRAETEQIPAHTFTLVHLEAAQIAEKPAIDRRALPKLNQLAGLRPWFWGRRWNAHERVFGSFVLFTLFATFIEHHEQRGHFAINICRCPVGTRTCRIRHNNKTDETHVGIFIPADMAVIKPRLGTRFTRTRTGIFLELPHVSKLRTWSDRGAPA